ncbi:MAG: DMP19 family protein [Clostridium sp.]|nr:DMP19 family protein [Clostridium sp.]
MNMEKVTVRIPEKEVIAAAEQGMDEFLQVFVDHIRKAVDGELNARTMPLLNGMQISLLAYVMFREEVMDGGFVQLIHNGYGPFIFDNPFARAMREMGAPDFCKLIYKGKKLYDQYKDELTRECSDEEFMALFERYEKFDDLDDAFVVMEEEVTEALARYVDGHIGQFAEIEKENAVTEIEE